VPHVRFADIQVDIAGIADAARLLDQVEEQIQLVQGQGPTAGLVLRARLVGRGPLHGDLASPDRTADLLKTMREEAKNRRPFLWWSGIVTATYPDLDREAIGRRGDFSAELLRLTSTLRGDGEMLSRFTQEEEKTLQGGALRRWVEAIPTDRPALLDEAETLALEQLEARSGQ
jgi:hypothetical protein